MITEKDIIKIVNSNRTPPFKDSYKRELLNLLSVSHSLDLTYIIDMSRKMAKRQINVYQSDGIQMAVCEIAKETKFTVDDIENAIYAYNYT